MNTKFFLDFVRQYSGNKLSILATGGGTSLAQLASVPGASSMLHSLYIPYDTNESMEYIKRFYTNNGAESFAKKAVCAEAAENLFFANWTKIRQAVICIFSILPLPQQLHRVVGDGEKIEHLSFLSMIQVTMKNVGN